MQNKIIKNEINRTLNIARKLMIGLVSPANDERASMTKDNDGWGSKWLSVPWQEPTKEINRVGIDLPQAPMPNWPKNDPENNMEEFSGVTPEMLGVKPDTFLYQNTGPETVNWSTQSSSVTWDKVSGSDKTTILYNNSDWSPVNFTGHAICDVDKNGNVDLTPIREKLTGWDLAKPNSDKTILSKDGGPQTELKSQGSNLVDTESYLYFQCEGCNKILDPETKSFKSLEEARYNAGWKVKWNTNGLGYKVYCTDCGDK